MNIVNPHSVAGEIICVLKEKEQAKYGESRTRRLVLEAWDRLDKSGPP